MAAIPGDYSALLETMAGPRRLESDEEWHLRLAELNAPDPKFDRATAIAEVAELEAFLAFARKRGYTHSGYEDEDESNRGLEDAHDDLCELREQLYIGPRWDRRRYIGSWLRPEFVDALFKTSPLFTMLRAKRSPTPVHIGPSPNAEWCSGQPGGKSLG